jgi:hypothetical protein
MYNQPLLRLVQKTLQHSSSSLSCHYSFSAAGGCLLRTESPLCACEQATLTKNKTRKYAANGPVSIATFKQNIIEKQFYQLTPLYS